jgi:DNA-binding transcriptional MerR regulator
VKYRVDELAAACGVSVDTIRYYQSMGLLPPPHHEGRVALYGPEHVQRLERIRSLKAKGLSLAVISRVLQGRLSRADADLAAAVAAAEGGEDEEFLTIEELARRSGVPGALLRAVQRAGLVLGRTVDGEERFTPADVEIVRRGLKMLDLGLPLDALLQIGQRYHEAARGVAVEAVELFDEHVREPIRAQAAGDEEAAERVVEAFRELLPAVTTLVSHHWRRLLLRTAMEYIQRVGDDAEVSASRAESRRLREATS